MNQALFCAYEKTIEINSKISSAKMTAPKADNRLSLTSLISGDEKLSKCVNVKNMQKVNRRLQWEMLLLNMTWKGFSLVNCFTNTVISAVSMMIKTISVTNHNMTRFSIGHSPDNMSVTPEMDRAP